MADNLTPLPVKTKTDGDVAVDLAQYLGAAGGASNAVHVQPGSGATWDTELPAAAALGDDAANPTAPAVGAFGMVWDGATWDRQPGTSADGTLVNLGANNDVTVTGAVDTELPAAAALGDDAANPTAPAVGAFAMVWDGATWDRLPGTSADGALVNLGANNDVSISGAVDTELPTAAALADAVANPTVPAVGAYAVGFNGTTWDRIRTANTGRLQVDVITGGGSDTPTTPLTEDVTSAALAAGASVDLDSTDVSAATKKLKQVDLWSSVPWKARIMTVANAVETIITVLGGPPMVSYSWTSPHKDYVTQGPAGAGFDGFRVEFTNLDNVDAADVYCTFYTEE